MLSSEYKTLLKEKFHFVFEKIEDPIFSISMKDMLNENTLKEMILEYAKHLETDNFAAAASIYTKYYGHMICGVPFLMSYLHLHLSAKPEHMTLYVARNNVPYIYFDQAAWIPTENAQSSQEWKDDCLTVLFQHNIDPFFRTIHNMTKIKLEILWENLLGYVNYMYREGVKELDVPDSLKTQIKQDHAYVTQIADPALYGDYEANPLHIEGTFIPHPDQPNEQFRIRKTCCLKKLTMDRTCCSNCPDLKLDTAMTS
ncbi:hypothetical protein [Longirhabdus pacifica]|uniref:hypothetical protein n=1 Tax=Longirhabdus pacifica TaxID=2305227 RepID=UPI001008DA9A|nr:hypothetical protein [Longirhabdus pacifica]